MTSQLPHSGCVKEEGRWNCQVWRRVIRHTWSEWSLITPEVNEASSLTQLYAERDSSWETVSFPCMHAGILMGPWRECWGIECRRSHEQPDPRSGRALHPWDSWRARMPGRIILGSAAGQRRTKLLNEAAAPRAPDQRGERVRPPDSGPYLDPSLSNTAPPSQTPQHDEDTRSPVYFGHFSPMDTILLFLLNKSLSEAWFHAHRLLFPPQTPLNKHNNEGFRIQEYFSRCKKFNCTTIHMVEKMYINLWHFIEKKIMMIN